MPSSPTIAPGSPTIAPASPTIVEEPMLDDAEPGDHDRFSHYVPKAKLTEAMINGTPVIALCGKVWVPSRDPERYPVCPACKDIKDKLPR